MLQKSKVAYTSKQDNKFSSSKARCNNLNSELESKN